MKSVKEILKRIGYKIAIAIGTYSEEPPKPTSREERIKTETTALLISGLKDLLRSTPNNKLCCSPTQLYRLLETNLGRSPRFPSNASSLGRWMSAHENELSAEGIYYYYSRTSYQRLYEIILI